MGTTEKADVKGTLTVWLLLCTSNCETTKVIKGYRRRSVAKKKADRRNDEAAKRENKFYHIESVSVDMESK